MKSNAKHRLNLTITTQRGSVYCAAEETPATGLLAISLCCERRGRAERIKRMHHTQRAFNIDVMHGFQKKTRTRQLQTEQDSWR